MSVAKAHLTVTADDQSRYQGVPNPPLTATYTGFLNNDTDSVVMGSPDLTTTAVASSPLGTYPINVGLGSLSATNYDFPSLVKGNLIVVSPGGTSVSISPSVSPPTYGQTLTFAAVVTPVATGAAIPTGTVQFYLSGTPIGSPVALVGGAAMSPIVAPVGAGTYTVSASYSGDTIYPTQNGGLSLFVAKRI